MLEFCDRGSLRDVLNASLIVALKARDAAATPYPGDGAHGDADPPPAAESLRPPSRSTAETQPQVESQPQLVEAGVRSGEGCRAPGGNREDCPLGYLDVLDTCSDVARAMLHMHSENIVHGGKPLLKDGGLCARISRLAVAFTSVLRQCTSRSLAFMVRLKYPTLTTRSKTQSVDESTWKR